MFQQIDGYGDRVIALRAVGKISADDYSSVVVPAVQRATASGEKARLLMELGPEFEGYEAGAVLADTKLGLADFKSFDRIAVVTDLDRYRHAIGLFAPFIPAAVRVFSVADVDQARTWISET